jgi:5-methylcytosine-specific restriction enzyme A
MSAKALRCLTPKLVTSNAGGWKSDEQRGNRHQRGYGWTWQQTRERILQRDNGLCQPHIKRGEIAVGNQVDHIISKAEARAQGWSESEIEADTNLQCICEACHLEKTSRESRRGGG